MRLITVLFVLCFAAAGYSQLPFNTHIIDHQAAGASGIDAADINNDGFIDVLSATFADATIAWYENDGSQSFTRHVIDNTVVGAVVARGVDLDNDGDMDVISGGFNDGEINWHENDGSQNFTNHVVGTVNAVRALVASDLDGDRDWDLVVVDASCCIYWLENDGNMNFQMHLISSGLVNPRSVRAGDLDGDGDMDVAAASYGNSTIYWYENNGSQGFNTTHVITASAMGAITIHLEDLDADGDLDVLSASELDNRIAWHENSGTGTFTAHNIATNAMRARWVFTADLDNDTDLDVISAARDNNNIVWYENNGQTVFTATHVISDSAIDANSVFATDMDGDSDIDVFSASFGDDRVAWYENLLVQGGTVHTRSFINQDSTRSYLLYVPAAYTGQEEWPLVINYHGYSSNATNQMNIHSKMNAIADTGHFLIAYPQGLVVEDLVFGGFGTGWNVFGTYSAIHDDVLFTNSLIDHVSADFNVDFSRIHATGWSNGGEMAFYVACELSDRIASVASVSNAMNDFLINSCQITRPFSSMLIHGTADPFFPMSGVPGFFSPPPTTPSFLASQNNCSSDSIVTELPDVVTTDSSTVTLIEYVNCDDNTEVLFYRVNNGGHPWPGSGVNIPFLGNTNMDINASSEIWNFFKRNPHPSPVGIADNIDNSVRNFHLLQNYPNPFNPSTTIEYRLAAAGTVELTIFSPTGERVRTLVRTAQSAGTYQVRWDGKNDAGHPVASGLYFYQLKAGTSQQTHKMLLVK